jgi:hypothetical protein
MAFVVLVVDSRRARLRQYGSIADRLCIPKIINVNGKNFISVNANLFGGVGVTIAQCQNLAIAPFGIITMTI